MRDSAHHCPTGLHSDVPIIEGNQTVGLVCTICGRSIRENMQPSGLVITDNGLEDVGILPHHRRDPRYRQE